MNFLALYEGEAGQLINKVKSCYIVGEKPLTLGAKLLKRLLGTRRSSCLLGIWVVLSLLVGKRWIFFNLLKKFEKKLAGWKANLLSSGGRIILVKHVLQSLLIYSIAAIEPPKTIIARIETSVTSICTKVVTWWLCKFRSPCRKAIMVVLLNNIC